MAEAAKQARVQEGARTVKPLVRVENRGDLPLSYGQQRLWFLEKMEPGNAVYNVPFALRIRGELDREALAESFRNIVERHEVLRTVFVSNREQEPVQRVLSVEEAGVVVEVTELGELARISEKRRRGGWPELRPDRDSIWAPGRSAGEAAADGRTGTCAAGDHAPHRE